MRLAKSLAGTVKKMKNLAANTLLNVAIGAGVHAVPILLLKNPPYPTTEGGLQGRDYLYFVMLFVHFGYMTGRAFQGISLTKWLLEYGGFLFGFHGIMYLDYLSKLP